MKKRMNRSNFLTVVFSLLLCPVMTDAQTSHSSNASRTLATDVEVTINVKENRSKKNVLTDDVIARAVEEGVRRALGEHEEGDLVVNANGGMAPLSEVASYLRNHPKSTVFVRGDKYQAQEVFNQLVRHYGISRNRISFKAVKAMRNDETVRSTTIGGQQGFVGNSQQSVGEPHGIVSEPQRAVSESRKSVVDSQKLVSEPQTPAKESVTTASVSQEILNNQQETASDAQESANSRQRAVGDRKRAISNGPGTIYDRYMTRQEQKGRKIERVSRELMTSTFIPKGQWMVGGTVNFSEWDIDNYNLTVLKNIATEGHTFSGSPYFGYFFTDNIAVGARYNYSRNYFFLGDFDLNLGEIGDISFEDIYYLGHTHTFDAFMRPYLPLDKSNVFGAFVDIRAGYAHTTSKNSTGRDAEYDGSYTHANTLQINVCPGMAVFATDFLAVEASIGIMGMKYRWVDQKTNHVETGRSRSGGANFRFNFLSVNIGLTFYL